MSFDVKRVVMSAVASIMVLGGCVSAVTVGSTVIGDSAIVGGLGLALLAAFGESW